MEEDNGAHFFEGTEKLLEVWFSRQDEAKGTGDLRTIPRWVNPYQAGFNRTRFTGLIHTMPIKPCLKHANDVSNVIIIANSSAGTRVVVACGSDMWISRFGHF